MTHPTKGAAERSASFCLGLGGYHCHTGRSLLHDLPSGEGRRGQRRTLESHALRFPPTSMTAEDSRKRAGWRRGIQHLWALLRNEGPQIPISTVQVSRLCKCVLALRRARRVGVCVCVHALAGYLSIPHLLSLGFYLLPGTTQHPQIFESSSDFGNSEQAW